MKERPIPFSAPMVRAILAGEKTQTRRVVKWRGLQQGLNLGFSGLQVERSGSKWVLTSPTRTSHEYRSVPMPCPYGQPGDRLWVREAWRSADTLDKFSPAGIGDAALAAGYSTPWAPLEFEADGARNQAWNGFGPGNGEVVGTGKLRPGMFMPRWASRILLQVTDVRVERLQDISEADAVAEGCKAEAPDDAVGAYEALWESINGPGSWDANPWVWVVSFRRLG